MDYCFKRIPPELSVASKPPVGSASSLLLKRHSIHGSERPVPLTALKKGDKVLGYGSHNALQRNEGSNSWANLRLLDSKHRSASLAELKTSGRTLSASNLAALSDSNLSVQVALPLRSYEDPGSQSNLAKKSFGICVKRYFDQLTVGCGSTKCRNKFCASSSFSRKINIRIASVLSIELARLGSEHFCNENTTRTKNWIALPTKVFDDEHGKPTPFLCKFFSCSPFKFLFSNTMISESKSKIKSESLVDLTNGIKPKCGSRNTMVPSFSASNLCDHTKIKSPGTHNHKSINQLDACNSKPLLPDAKDNFTVEDNEVVLDKVSSTSSVHELDFGIECLGTDSCALEEFEEDCALEMSSGYIKELSLTHLTLQMLESSIENYEKCHDSSFLINTIRTVFTSPEALNESFQKASKEPQWAKLDLDGVRQAYQLLFNLEPKPVFLNPLQNSAEIHLKTLQSCDIRPLQVFQLVILLENPFVLETHNLLQIFCGVLAQLSPKTKNALVGILTHYDSFNFQRIVKAIQKLLGSQVQAESHIVIICMALLVLYEANIESQKRGEQLVPFSFFYNKELSKKLDYKKEYEKWVNVGQLENFTISSSETLSKISVLKFPFVLEPASKVRLMHIHAAWQMGTEYRDAVVYQARVEQARKVYEGSEDFQVEDPIKSAMSPFLVLQVRRDHLIEDTLVQMQLKENDLKKALKIRYVGGGEEGLDLGGLQKEFFHIIINDIIQPDYGMFLYLDEVQRMWINSTSLESDEMFELIGMLLGIAIYNGIILELHFPPVIYKKLQGGKANFADLGDVDPLLARSLQSLLDFDSDVEETFCYTFQVSVRVFGEIVDVDLKNNGKDIAVTNQNRKEFVALYVDYILNESIERQFSAFHRGFQKVCDDTCLKLFQTEELELLICGSPVIDFSAIEESTTYSNGFTCSHSTIVSFWDIVHNMNSNEKKSLLLFVTGSDRVPLQGLSTVSFQIVKVGEDSAKLPTALTCFNQLMLPCYSSIEKLRERLLLAVQNSKGFGLT